MTAPVSHERAERYRQTLARLGYPNARVLENQTIGGESGLLIVPANVPARVCKQAWIESEGEDHG